MFQPASFFSGFLVVICMSPSLVFLTSFIKNFSHFFPLFSVRDVNTLNLQINSLLAFFLRSLGSERPLYSSKLLDIYRAHFFLFLVNGEIILQVWVFTKNHLATFWLNAKISKHFFKWSMINQISNQWIYLSSVFKLLFFFLWLIFF